MFHLSSSSLRSNLFGLTGPSTSIPLGLRWLGVAVFTSFAMVWLIGEAQDFNRFTLVLVSAAPETRRNAAETDAPKSRDRVLHSLDEQYRSEIAPLLKTHCTMCHGPDDENGGVRFDTLKPQFGAAASLEHWKRTRQALVSKEMPPEDEPPLDESDRKSMIEWLDASLEQATATRRRERGVSLVRRLSKRELNHTLQDLFNAPANFVERLPEDPLSTEGYDTSKKMLMVSRSDLKQYLETARTALDRYVRFDDVKETTERYFFEIEDVYHFGRHEGDKKTRELAPAPISEDKVELLKRARTGKKPVFRDRKYGPLPHGLIPSGVVRGLSEGSGFERLHQQFISIKTNNQVGEVTVRISAAATRGADGTYPRMRLEAGTRHEQALTVRLIGEADVKASLDQPGNYEFTFQLEDALPPQPPEGDSDEPRLLLLVISNVARNENGVLAGSPNAQTDLTLGGTDPVIRKQTLQTIRSGKRGLKKWENANTHFLHLDAMEAVIRPVSENPESPWLVPVAKSADQRSKIVTQTLNRFLPRLFRRPLVTGELSRYVELFEKLQHDGDDFHVALKSSMASAMISPSFLFIGQPSQHPKQTDFAFASRLSYLIWSSMPDPQLISLAASDQLRQRDELAAEVERMLADPKARRFSSAFARQWLGLHKLADIPVNREMFDDYGPDFADLIIRQTVETFQDVVHNRRDARTLFRSDYTLLNNRLARHYGLEPLRGGDLRRVNVQHSTYTSGILSQASLLTINSDGNESHPVKRGVWLLERVLHDPPPPPPPVVPDINDSDPLFKNRSLKEKIELHREQNSCTGCHEKIDPWGIAFEEFDAMGRWRTGPGRVDAETELPDGTMIEGVKELSNYLLKEREEQLMSGFVKHLMEYSIGRELDVLDKDETEHLFREFRDSKYDVQQLVLSIVQSDAFTLDWSDSK